MSKEKDLIKHKEFYDKWMTEIIENPRFSNESLHKNDHLSSYSKQFLQELFSMVTKTTIPKETKEQLDPVLELWHKLLHQQVSQGFTTKETAVLIYSLKHTLLKDEESIDQKESLDYLLDLLGQLTFEMYTLEKEKLISKQNHQIKYLQTHQTQFDKEMIGSSPAMSSVYKAIGLVVDNTITILLEGESGTGKDLIANIIHKYSTRSAKPFVTVNCGAIPKDLIESELFGHEKGAFTGALEKKIGKFELADGGTLFLDEIGELPLDLQVKLLRALQNKEIERVGGTSPLKINTRIITATNKNLQREVKRKRFRLDLFYRLNVFPIIVPPLRERKEDILPLASHFLEIYSSQFKVQKPALTNDAEHYLLNHYWEGNIRELENLIQRAIILSQGSDISSLTLSLKPGETETIIEDPRLALPEPSAHPPIQRLDELEKTAITRTIAHLNGNLKKASEVLGVSRTTLYNKISKYEISS
jgi:transcriptional regulator with GAF, ATPase, and Fis domain